MGEFHPWESFDMFVKFPEIVDNYLLPNIFISHPIILYQKLIFMLTKIPNQKSVLYAPLLARTPPRLGPLARQLLDFGVSQFNAREDFT